MPFSRAIRYGRHWLSGAGDVTRSDQVLSASGAVFDAFVFRPSNAGDRPLPGWVLLHGITRPGRLHPSLMRFSQSLAASGAIVVVPEVSEWVGLELAPHRTAAATRAGLEFLEADPQAVGRSGLAGFSFGAPQAIRQALDPELHHRLGSVTAFGGYSDLERTLRFLMTGLHEWDGRTERLRPDPYGRWIVAANYLTGVPGYESAIPVAEALRSLAAEAGDLQVESWDPSMDPIKKGLRADLDGNDRELFDYFAPDAGDDPPMADERSERWVVDLAAAGRERDPGLELPDGQLKTPVPIHVVHGAADSLIPSSEGRRLGERLRQTEGSLTITRLFSHSSEDGTPHLLSGVRENLRFFNLLNRILQSV